MTVLERIRALDTSKKKILLVACVTIGMMLVLSLWILIAPPRMPVSADSANGKNSGTTEDFKKALEEFKGATTEITGAINNLSEAIKNVASTSPSTSSGTAIENIPASSTP